MALSNAAAIVDLVRWAWRSADCVIDAAVAANADVDAATVTATVIVAASVPAAASEAVADAAHWRRQKSSWHMPAPVAVDADRRNAFAAAGIAVDAPAWFLRAEDCSRYCCNCWDCPADRLRKRSRSRSQKRNRKRN